MFISKKLYLLSNSFKQWKLNKSWWFWGKTEPWHKCLLNWCSILYTHTHPDTHTHTQFVQLTSLSIFWERENHIDRKKGLLAEQQQNTLLDTHTHSLALSLSHTHSLSHFIGIMLGQIFGLHFVIKLTRKRWTTTASLVCLSS